MNCWKPRSNRYSRLVRVYVPATLAMLQQLVADRLLHARSGTRSR